MARGYWFTADRDVLLPDGTILEITGITKIERNFGHAQANEVSEPEAPYEDTTTLEVLQLPGVA